MYIAPYLALKFSCISPTQCISYSQFYKKAAFLNTINWLILAIEIHYDFYVERPEHLNIL